MSDFEKPCFVYVIEALNGGVPQHLTKVGITQSVYGRLYELQTASPFQLSLYHYYEFPNRRLALASENAFHTVMKKVRMVGEWFALSANDAHQGMCANIRGQLNWALEDSGEYTPFEIGQIYAHVVGMNR